MSRHIASLCLLVVALAAVGATPLSPRIETIEGIDFNSLFERLPPLGRVDPYGTPEIVSFLANPFRPLSARTLYRPFLNVHANQVAQAYPNNVITDNTQRNDVGYNTLMIEGSGFGPGGSNILRAFLVPNGASCQGVATTIVDSCSGPAGNVLPFDNTGIDTLDNCELQQSNGGASGTDTVRYFLLPVRRLAMRAFEAPAICVALDLSPAGAPGTQVQEIHTQLAYQTVPGCELGVANTTTVGTITAATSGGVFNDPLGAAQIVQPFPTSCVAQAGFLQGGHIEPTDALDFFDQFLEGNEDLLDFLERRMRTVCCGSRAFIANPGLRRRLGVCINPRTESCCSGREDHRSQLNNLAGTGKPYDTFREKCCFGGEALASTEGVAPADPPLPVVTSFLDDFCPCVPARVNDFCGSQQRCCSFTKFPEIVAAMPTGALAGRCYDPLTEGCCETGETYNPGSHQCCIVNGVQSLDLACPCSDKSDCRGFNQTCCKQQFPVPDQGVGEWCDAYSNYPTGTGPLDKQRCLGRCIDLRFQICCNGVACIDEFERCCNTTCCNRFTSTCTIGWRAGAPGQAFNHREFMVPYEVCSSLEALTTHRAAAVFVLPTALLVATLFGLAISLFFAKRQNALNPLSGYEKFVLGLAILVVIFAWPLYFSPVWKYGVVWCWVAFFTIIAALAGLKRLIVVALFLQILALIYFFDWFGGNDILNLGYMRLENGDQTRAGFGGIYLSLRNLWSNSHGAVPFPGFRCVDWYEGYFLRDPATEDQLRIHNPERYTFGYCTRGWIATLMYLQGVEMLLLIFLFFACLVTHAKNVLIRKVIAQNPLHY